MSSRNAPPWGRALRRALRDDIRSGCVVDYRGKCFLNFHGPPKLESPTPWSTLWST